MSRPTPPIIRLLDGAWYAEDPHPSFAWMRAHAPVFWDEVGQVWGVASYRTCACPRSAILLGAPPRLAGDPSDDQHGRPGTAGARLRTKGLHAPRARLTKIRAIYQDLVARAVRPGRCDFVRRRGPLP
jgi:hypothetical protein